MSANVAVGALGSYTFPSVNGRAPDERISTNAGITGSLPAVLLPSARAITGKQDAQGDGTVNGITNTFTVTTTNTTNVNFGIEQTPTPSSLSATSQVNPGGINGCKCCCACYIWSN